MRLRNVLVSGLLAAVPVSLFLCLNSGAAQSNSYETGLQLYRAGQYAAAANKLLEAVRLPGKEGSAYYYLGCCYYKLNRGAEARPLYRTVVNDYPQAHEATLAAQMLHRLDPSYIPPAGLGDAPKAASPSSAVPTVSQVASLAAAIAGRSPGFPGEDFSKLPDEARIPFTTDPSGHMRVTAYLENRPIEAWFDTGANAHFGKNHLSASNIPLPRGEPNATTGGWAGNVVPCWRQSMHVKLGSLTRLAPVTIEENMSMLPLVGQEFIQGYQCEVDNNSHYINLRKASAFKGTSSAQVSSLYDVPCIRRGMRDYVTMTINGKKLEVLVDTGADSSTFNPNDLASIGVRVPDDAPRSTANGVGGSFTLQTIYAECRLGPIWKKDFPIAVGGSSGSAVGQDFLGSQRFTIDREKNLMRFFH